MTEMKDVIGMVQLIDMVLPDDTNRHAICGVALARMDEVALPPPRA